jgi:hypothetical protein
LQGDDVDACHFDVVREGEGALAALGAGLARKVFEVPTDDL